MAQVQIGTKALGSTVKIKINNTAYDFMVVNKTSSAVTLWMKGYYGTQVFGNNQTYAGSSIDTYANGTFYNLIDKVIRDQIINTTINTNGTTIQRKVYLPSMTEIGGTHSYALTTEGPTWQYFSDTGGSTGSNTKRAYSGSAGYAWLRSRNAYDSSYCWIVDTDGFLSTYFISYSYDFRPAFNLPSSLFVSDDGSVVVNNPPTTPGTINLPTSILAGQSFEVSWSASTDPEGDSIGYELDRSTDGGSNWSNIYKSTAAKMNDTVATGTQTVMYRVRAYDASGSYSGYKVSTQKDVINNQKPTDPSSITVPNLSGGKPANIFWGESTDPDRDEVGYALERKVDSGNWTEIYRGASMSYSDNIVRGWGSVTYRVRAYDSKGLYSGYTTSNAKMVNNNQAPSITGDKPSGSDLGTITSLSFGYTVNDEEGDPVTVKELLDAETRKETQPELGQKQTYSLSDEEFMQILNGQHTARVTASDGMSENEYSLTFTKNQTSASVTLKNAMPASEAISVCVLAISGSIPADADLQVLVSNNALDDSPTWEDATNAVKSHANYIFQNNRAVKTPAFNFKVTVSRGASGVGGYIHSIQGGFQ